MAELDVMITPHFSMAEGIVSARFPHLQESPTDLQLRHMTVLAAGGLEPARNRVGCPLQVNSWLRSPATNRAVGGWSESRHLLGLAADIEPLGKSRLELWRALLELAEGGVPFTRLLIYETKSHVHVEMDYRAGPTAPIIQAVPARGRAINWVRYTGPLKPSRSAGMW